MKINLPKKATFWASVVIAVIGLIAFVVHLFAINIPYLGMAGFILIVAAYALIFLGLTIKGL